MHRDFDIVIFGATGYTGKCFVPYIQKHAKTTGFNFTWAIAGRSEIKLKETVNLIEKQFNISLEDVPIIIANVDQESTLEEMARRTRILINCCGPYRFLGEPVVKACLKENTHYIDVNGEPQFAETIELKYKKQAEKDGIYVLSCCGFDSIPADLGAVFLQQQFNGTVNSISFYLDWDEMSRDGIKYNYATWESLVYSLANSTELRGIRKKLWTKNLPKCEPQIQAKTWPHKSTLVGGWAIPFNSSDRSIMKRTQRYFFEQDSSRPAQVEAFIACKSLLSVVWLALFGLAIMVLSKFNLGRKWLLKCPEFFTNGLFTKLDTPNSEVIPRCTFTFKGKGWKKGTLRDPLDSQNAPINKEMIVRVCSKNSAYEITCIALFCSTIALLSESDKMPSTGGVYTPGAAFAKTSLIQQLQKNGIDFEILSEKEL